MTRHKTLAQQAAAILNVTYQAGLRAVSPIEAPSIPRGQLRVQACDLHRGVTGPSLVASTTVLLYGPRIELPGSPAGYGPPLEFHDGAWHPTEPAYLHRSGPARPGGWPHLLLHGGPVEVWADDGDLHLPTSIHRWAVIDRTTLITKTGQLAELRGGRWHRDRTSSELVMVDRRSTVAAVHTEEDQDVPTLV